MTQSVTSNKSFQSLGELISFRQDEHGVYGTTAQGYFRVQCYSSEIFRISISKESSFDDFSYAVIAAPEKKLFQLLDTKDALLLVTPKAKLHVHKNPVRFMLTTLKDEVINEDDAGMGTGWIGEQVTTYKKLQEGERFIGLGEKTGPLDRRGNAYQNWNSDAFAYSPGADPLYCSTPFYIGLHHQKMYGIFLDNSFKSFFNFGASTNRFSSFSADAGDMNYYLMTGASVAEIIQGYTHLTGRIEIPPLWSIGYQQCRYSYYPDKEVLSLAKTFREKDIPADVIVLDIHYMDQYKIFTWNNKSFPDPKKLVEELRALGFHVVVICDPGIKVEEGYTPFDEGLKKELFLKYPDGEVYAGQVWPGWCHFPDFTKEGARTWWEENMKGYAELGIEGYWNDMNEIATWGQAMPESLVFDFEGRTGTTRNGRNIYGFQMARATFEGAKNNLKGKRPFNLTRSGFSGVQRYGAVWTGDNVSYDEHMILGVRLISSMGLTGIAFAGYDVGGFVGEANSKLFTRWISIGALSPFFRGHTMINSRDSEPWSYGEEAEQIARNYIKFRYQLLPYIYSLFYEAAQTGMPVQRSLSINYPFTQEVYDHRYHNQYLFGPYILVAPSESSKELTRIFLPEGEWFYLYDGKNYSGGQEIILDSPVHKLPVFIKESAILPMQPAVDHTGESPDLLILHLYHGSREETFTFYQDDGETYAYQTGDALRQQINFNPANKKISINSFEQTYRSRYKKLRIVLHGFEDISQAIINGSSIVVTKEIHAFFSPLEKFDPFYDPDSMGEESVQILETDYSINKTDISW